MLPGHPQRLELLAQPSDPPTEIDAPAREEVEVRDLLGGVDRRALGDQADSRTQADALGVRGQPAERQEGLDRAGGVAGDSAIFAVGVSGGVFLEEDHVLRDPERVKSPALRDASHLREEVRGRVGARSCRDPDLHEISSRRELSHVGAPSLRRVGPVEVPEARRVRDASATATRGSPKRKGGSVPAWDKLLDARWLVAAPRRDEEAVEWVTW